MKFRTALAATALLMFAAETQAAPFVLVAGLRHNGTTKVDITDPNNDNFINTAEWGLAPTVVNQPGNGIGTYNTIGQGEVVAKLFDNSYANSSGPWGGSSSKTCCSFTPGVTSIGVQSSTTAYSLTGYTLSNGNDVPQRRPTGWRLYGSNDNFFSQFLLDTVVASDINGGLGWTADNQTGEVTFGSATAAYSSFRFVFDTSVSGNNFQLSEIELFGTASQVPEPTTISLCLFGLGSLGYRRARERRRQKFLVGDRIERPTPD